MISVSCTGGAESDGTIAVLVRQVDLLERLGLPVRDAAEEAAYDLLITERGGDPASPTTRLAIQVLAGGLRLHTGQPTVLANHSV